jgi:hypothetical protein
MFFIVDTIKNDGLALYTFMPFCYQFLGIDLFQHYERNVMPSSKFSMDDFTNYPRQITGVFNQLSQDYEKEFEGLLKIRKYLVAQGAYPAKFL